MLMELLGADGKMEQLYIQRKYNNSMTTKFLFFVTPIKKET